MLRRLLLAALLLAACEVSSVPTPVGVTTTTEGISASTTVVVDTSAATTTAAPAPAARPGPTAAPRPTVTEPELCPGLPHPAHHQPCPPATTRASSVSSPAPPASEPCGQALVGVRAVGLPAGFTFHCSAAKAQGHAGITYWDPAGGSYIAINPRTGDHPGVGAHEACHAVDFVTRGASTEAGADACAEAHGHPNPYAGQLDDVIIGETPAEKAERWLIIVVLLAGLVLIVALITLLPAARRRLRHGHHDHRKDQP